ncbi:MAG: precorrin-6y C5,15-methyltransferase (decarboxylating) subunit CbiE [Hoeflea sp.]|uniref:precorrin-6y C5,15-methyltransferase (decarboxylating) subunit CbiE n=1 Tax=Hoeflea sp. TaxID=1940281 RepID=UPI001D87ACCB|nr:precorrin-6y C5,15-methyltransferase (decarboxylating) subunit CbiE [Hoeflea sp.]MBU4531077.1 precorrin-6y C5,15-methyltransferase (decarboxylating) subunit CbiE [Alphaproteobacteria bacterium]MBU4542852.1 precorrin-6y C5,15-methyltransferase (decarboxylating) subunit CbiE [Alphaproteobacteria bacterium]MBU4552664.1 precorrin-6y C5,15-methyltransferase (decarboxylating) subunit CbiE [Alphaproteobacteria bacterium]MBV1722969.1 precorrin-6y C5,15-methyltransferase (decarboxylating) subunit Cbi
MADTAWLTILGIGDNGLDSLTPPARALFEASETIIAPERVLARIDCGGRETIPWTFGIKETIAYLMARRGRPTTILATGDPMFYGVGATLMRSLDTAEMRVIPSPSAFSLAAARLGWALQDVAMISLHGRSVHGLASHVQPGARIIALTSTGRTVIEAAQILSARGYGRSEMQVLEHIGGPAERIKVLRADRIAADKPSFADFNTLAIECVAEPGAVLLPAVPGLQDEAFEHDGQLTKREVRAVTLARLGPVPGGLLWDVGAGCGSIGIEWMRAARGARAIAIESSESRRTMTAHNAIVLGAPGLDIVAGAAPAALADLAMPDAVFIGGGISHDGVFEAAWEALRPSGRLVANAVTVEGEARLFALQSVHGGELIRLQVNRAEPVGRYLGWKPLMPVTIWSVTKDGSL